MEIYSLQKVINLFESIATNHLEIEVFNFGEIDEIDQIKQSDDHFIGMWLELSNTQLIIGKSNMSTQRRFRFYIYDLIRQDLNNVNSNWNQCESIGIDVVRLLTYGSSEYRLVNNPILYPFSDQFANNASGVWCEVTLESFDAVGTCGVATI